MTTRRSGITGRSTRRNRCRNIILNFEACDYKTQVWVNDKKVGEHVGGNTPFSFDITEAVTDETDHLYVRVEDATGGFQLRGKQTKNPRGIWYTQVSGIWGTVWLEQVSDYRIDKIHIKTEISGKVTVKGDIIGPLVNKANLHGFLSIGGQRVGSAMGNPLVFNIENPRLWTPETPHLYDLYLSIQGVVPESIDSAHSYFGIREVGREKDAKGHWRFTLNGKPIFHWGPLDQGWWPDGLHTPPSEEAMRWDVDYLKKAGFNMIRKHIKIEPRLFYAYCDKVGMLVWQDQPSGGPNPKWTRLQPNPKDAVWPDKEHKQFLYELDEMISSLENHPSIAVWVPFNEAWGQHRTMTVGKWTVKRDPSRLVNVASGGNFWPVGHILDHHAYPHPQFPFDLGKGGRFDGYVKVMGEFGGHGLPTPGHLWDNARRNWGYGGLPNNAEEYKERYVESLRLLVELQKNGIAGAVYTQTTDVEGEINGLVTYDRKKVKIPADELRELHKVLFE